MKRLHASSFCSHAAAWLVLVLLSPALLAEPAAGGIAKQLRDGLERQGWEMERAPDGSLIYNPPHTTHRQRDFAESLGQALERQGWRMEKGSDGSRIYWPPKVKTTVTRQPATTQPGPADKPGEVREQPDPQTRPAADAREKAPALVEEPGTATLTEALGARPTEDRVEVAIDKETPTQSSEAASRPPEQVQRLRTPRRSWYYGHPMYRPLPPMRRYQPPPGAYRRVGPPCPYGLRDCGWRTGGRRPGSPAPGGREQSRPSNAADE
jgi:hypothetical protein